MPVVSAAADARLARRPQRLVLLRMLATSSGRLTFSLVRDPRARGLEAMVRPPPRPDAHAPDQGRPAGEPEPRTVKGVDYLVFDGQRGLRGHLLARCRATGRSPPVSASADGEGHATVSWATDEPASSRVDYGRTSALGTQVTDSARVSAHKRRAHRPEPRDHLLLPRDLGGRARQLGLGAGLARELHDAGGRARGQPHLGVRGGHPGRHIRRRHARRRRRRGPAPAGAWGRSSPARSRRLAGGPVVRRAAAAPRAGRSAWTERPRRPAPSSTAPGRSSSRPRSNP